MTVVGVGVIPIKPDFGNFHRDVQREGSKAADGLTSHFKGAFKSIAALGGGVLVGAGLVSGLKSAFAEAAEAQKVGKLTEQVIKTTGGAAKITAKQIGDLSTAISKKAGIDDEAIQSGANLVATFCLEESAEALTKDRGWVNHTDLHAGDEILGYDPETDLIEWQSVDSMHRFQVNGDLVRWKSKQIDVATTPHHRWWTECSDDRLRYTPQFRTTEEISGHQIDVKIGGGTPYAFAGEATYSDDLVELAGWVMTEGWFPKWRDQAKGRRPRNCAICGAAPARNLAGPARCDGCALKRIQGGRTQPTPKVTAETTTATPVGFCQSETANPLEVKRIRSLVARLRMHGHRIGETSYIAAYNGSRIIEWHFSGDLGRTIRAMLPDKKLTPPFISALTVDQAENLLDLLIAADGHARENGSTVFVQKDREQLGIVAMLAAMLGRRTTLQGTGDRISFPTSNRLGGTNVHARPEHYDGVVWCPSLRTGIFMARCNGRTFWTGNTNVRNEAGKGNDVFSQTVGLATDMSVALGQDMKSSSLQLGKALNDPIKGIGALSRAGVSFTQDQKDQIKVLQESGDILGAQKIILKEVGTEFGGAAAAAASPVDKLKVVWGNLLETIGTKGLPIVEKVADWLSKVLPQALDIAGDAFRRVSDVLGPFFKTLFSGFTEDEGTPIERFALRVRDVFFTLLDAGKVVFGFLKDTVVPGIKNALSDLISGFTGGDASGFFGRLGAAARTAYDFIKDTVIPGIQRVVGSFMDGLQGKGGEGSFFTDLGEAARGAFKIFKEDVLPVIQTVAAWIGDHLKPILIGLGIAFVVLTGPIAVLVGAFIFAYQKFQWFRDGVELFMGIIKAVITTAIDVIVVVFKGIVWTIQNVVMPIFNTLKVFLVDFVFPLIGAVIRDILIPAFQDIWHTVQTVWDFVKPIFEAIVKFISEKLAPVWSGISDAAKMAFNALPGLIGAALRLVGGIISGFLSGVGSIADALGLDSIGKVLKDGANSAKNWGAQGPATRDLGAGQLLRASGGGVPGRGNGDTVPAMLTPGEFVIRKDSVRKYGAGFMEMINAGRFAKGGLIPGIPDIDLDGIVRKGRQLGASALDSVWPKMAVANNFTGLPAGGANYLRDAVIGLIRGSTASGPSGGAGISGTVADWIHQAMRIVGVPESWFPALAARVKLESGGNPRAINLWDCLTIDALILTERGWLKHDEVRVGDRTIGYNAETGQSEWTTIERIVHYSDAPLVRLGNSRWHATTTPNHRWLTLPRETKHAEPVGDECHLCAWPANVRPRRGKTTAGGLRIHLAKIHGIRATPAESVYATTPEFTSTEDINSRDRLLLSAPAETGVGLPISDAEAAVLGWLAGDGHIEERRWGPSMSIAQSKPPMVEKLKVLLADFDVATYVDERPTRMGNEACGPRYQFRFKPAYRVDLLGRAGHPKHDAEAMVRQMSRSQREAWLEAFIDAEGTQVGGHVSVSQTYGPVLDAAHLAIYLCGHRPRLVEVVRKEKHWSPCAHLSLCRPIVTGAFLNKEDAGTGDVWCVTTGLGSWTAEQDGQIFLTGNSNAMKGTPSMGMWQMIRSTFDRWKLPGYPDIWNPVDEGVSAIRYIIGKYGSIFNTNPHTGYALGGLVAHQRSFDSGGVLAPGWNAVRNDTGRAEALSPTRGRALAENVFINSPEDVDEFWSRGLFHATAGQL